MLLTFGLLGPNKGVETVIRALPALVAALPDLVYFVVGATHPAVLRQNGEAYRTSLERRGRAAGRSRARRVPRSVRHDRGAVQLPAGGRRLREPVPQRGPGHERRAVVRDGRGRGRRLDALLARARSCSPTGAGACSRSATASAWRDDDRGAVRRSGGAGARRAARLRVHARLHLAARRRAVPAAGRDAGTERAPARGVAATSRARAASPSCASTTCCA